MAHEMKDAEFRALVAAGPTVVMVENGHMLALLDERDRLAAALGRIEDEAGEAQKSYDANGPQWTGKDGHEYADMSYVLDKCSELQAIARAALAPTRADGGDA